MPLEAIGRELRITRERVRQLEREALAKLGPELEGVVDATGDDDLASRGLARLASRGNDVPP